MGLCKLNSRLLQESVQSGSHYVGGGSFSELQVDNFVNVNLFTQIRALFMSYDDHDDDHDDGDDDGDDGLLFWGVNSIGIE